MMKLITVCSSIALTLSLSGCVSTFFGGDSRLCIGDNGVYQRCGSAAATTAPGNGGNAANPAIVVAADASIAGQQSAMAQLSKHDNQALFQPRHHHKVLGEYVEQLAMALMQSIDQDSLDGAVAISSFVRFDSTLNRADALGNQLSELFFVELQQYGLPLVDYKIGSGIQVTATGDFIFSRDISQLRQQPSFAYVLSGTLLASDRGVVVNARISGLKDQNVVASAKGLIPAFVLPRIYAKVAGHD